jgi:hypothetical protein
MDCCPTQTETDVQNGDASANEVSTERCNRCGTQGRPVSRKTMPLMLRPHFLEGALSGTFSFCPDSDCRIVYFEEQGGRVFTTDDLRVVVGVKAKSDPIPVCYCFGLDESHFRDEISQMGSTTIPDRISSLIREGLCACEARNPSGACCLGEVNRTAKRLREEVSVGDSFSR